MNCTKTPSGPISVESVGDQLPAPRGRLVEQRQAGDEGRDRLVAPVGRAFASGRMRRPARSPSQARSAARASGRSADRIRRAPVASVEAALDQRPGDRSGAGAEFDDEPAARVDRGPRHGAGQRPPGRRDRARSAGGRRSAILRKCAPSARARRAPVLVRRPAFALRKSWLPRRTSLIGASAQPQRPRHQPLEELFHLGEEAGAFRVGLVRRFGVEFHQQLALPPRQVLRRLDVELDKQVADVARAQDRHALAAQSAAAGPTAPPRGW